MFEEGHISIASVIYMIMGWLGRTKKKLQPPIKSKLPPKILYGRPIGWFDGDA